MGLRRITGEGEIVRVNKRFAFIKSEKLNSCVYFPVEADLWGSGDLRHNFIEGDTVVFSAEKQEEKDDCKYLAAAACPKSKLKVLEGEIDTIEPTIGYVKTSEGRVFFTKRIASEQELTHAFPLGTKVIVTVMPQPEFGGCTLFAVKLSKNSRQHSPIKSERRHSISGTMGDHKPKVIEGIHGIVVDSDASEGYIWNREIFTIPFNIRSVRTPTDGLCLSGLYPLGTRVKFNAYWSTSKQQFVARDVDRLIVDQTEGHVAYWIDDKQHIICNGIGLICQVNDGRLNSESSHRSPLFMRHGKSNEKPPRMSEKRSNDSHSSRSSTVVRIWNDDLGLLCFTGEKEIITNLKPLTAVHFQAELQNQDLNNYFWRVICLDQDDQIQVSSDYLVTTDRMTIDFTTPEYFGFASNTAIGRVYLNNRSLNDTNWLDLEEGQNVRMTMYRQYHDTRCEWCAVFVTPLINGHPTKPHYIINQYDSQVESRSPPPNDFEMFANGHTPDNFLSDIEAELRCSASSITNSQIKNEHFTNENGYDDNLAPLVTFVGDHETHGRLRHLSPSPSTFDRPFRPFSPTVGGTTVNRPPLAQHVYHHQPYMPRPVALPSYYSPAVNVHNHMQPRFIPHYNQNMYAPQLIPVIHSRSPTPVTLPSPVPSTVNSQMVGQPIQSEQEIKTTKDVGCQSEADSAILFLQDLFDDDEIKILIFKKCSSNPDRLMSIIKMISNGNNRGDQS